MSYAKIVHNLNNTDIYNKVLEELAKARKDYKNDMGIKIFDWLKDYFEIIEQTFPNVLLLNQDFMALYIFDNRFEWIFKDFEIVIKRGEK